MLTTDLGSHLMLLDLLKTRFVDSFSKSVVSITKCTYSSNWIRVFKFNQFQPRICIVHEEILRILNAIVNYWLYKCSIYTRFLVRYNCGWSSHVGWIHQPRIPMLGPSSGLQWTTVEGTLSFMHHHGSFAIHQTSRATFLSV